MILKYSADEARNLKACPTPHNSCTGVRARVGSSLTRAVQTYGELPADAKINESAAEVEFGDDDDVEFDFDEVDDI